MGTSSADIRRIPAVMMELSGTWKERFDNGTGAPYWTNIETGLSTSVRPTSGGIIPAEKKEGPKNVPSGWTERFDNGTGAPYWTNNETGLSTSVRPTSPAASTGGQKQESARVDSPGTSARVDSAGTWKERFDNGTGAPYWTNIKTGLSTSVRPTSGGIIPAEKKEGPKNVPSGWTE